MKGRDVEKILNKWSGRDLTPLAYESSISCILRLAWRNVFDHTTIMRHLSSQNNRFRLDQSKLFDQVGWSLCDDSLLEFNLKPNIDCTKWLAKQFRYCPICLEYGYHSYLFQCSYFSKCPLHNVELSTHCQNCGSATPINQFSKELFKKPYYCHVCLKPISGAVPHLEGHLDLRMINQSLKLALTPFNVWHQYMKTQSIRFQHFYPDISQGMQSKWCDVSEFLRCVALKGKTIPDFVKSPQYAENDIVVLPWKYRIRLGNCSDFFLPKSNWRTRVKIPTAVYRCTIRKIGEWVAKRHGWSERQLIEEMEIERGTQIKAYPTDLLAFIFVRGQLEQRFVDFPCFRSRPLSNAQLYDEPMVCMESFNRRTPRLAWRAVFLALYSSWYLRIASGKYYNFGDLLKGDTRECMCIYLRNRVRCRIGEKWHDGQIFNPDEAWYEGEVCFLNIEGFVENVLSHTSL